MTTTCDSLTRVVLPPVWESSAQSFRDALGAVSECELWALTDDQVIAGTAEMFQLRAGLDEICARFVCAADDRKLPRLAGATSTATWLKNLCKISRAEAHRVVKRSALLCDAVEDTRKAWAGGQISTDQATVICEALVKLPTWVGVEGGQVAQEVLLGWARACSFDELTARCARILELIDPDGAEEQLGKDLDKDEKKAWGKTSLSMFNAGDGMTRGRFTIPTVQAGIFKTALEGLASPRRNDPRIYDRDGEHSDAANGTLTHDMKLGRAFCELLEHLSTDAMPQHGGLAATITISMTLDQLKDGLGTALLSTGDTMSAAQARRFACNANLIPIVLDGNSKILDLGMAQRLYDRYQRIAMAERDKGCCWKGCDRPPSWCEAHHLTHWCKGGPTDLAGGALFCFYHHHLLHEGEWDARMGADGIVEVIPPKRIDPQQKPIRHDRFKAGP